MPDLTAMIRIRPQRTSAACKADQDERGHLSKHVGDVVKWYPGSQEFTARERGSYALIRITDIPLAAALRLTGRVEESTGERDGDGKEVMRLVRPRRYRVSRVALEAEFPALANRINRLFRYGETIAQKDIPEVPWLKVKAVWVDKDNSDILTSIDDEDKV